MEVHPLAELIPPMGDEDYASLRDSIRDKGQELPIILFEDQILDGRHRQRVCDELSIQPKYDLYEGNDPAGYVISMNLERRHLTTGQRAAAALALLEYEKDRAKERQRESGGAHPGPIGSDEFTGTGEAAEIAGKKLGVSADSVKKARSLANDRPDLHEKVKTGDISLNAAVEEQRGKPTGGRGIYSKANRPAEFVVHSKRDEGIAKKNKLRMERAVGTANGIVSGFPHMKVSEACALATDEEIRGWIGAFDEAIRSIRQLKQQLEDIR